MAIEPMRVRPDVRPRVAVADIAAYLDVEMADDETIITGIALNTSHVEAGDLYAAIPGEKTHGAAYAGQALASGAVAVMTDAEGAALAGGIDAPMFVVADARASLAGLSRHIYGSPGDSMFMLGITGTQGKTTSSYLAEAALLGAGLNPAVIGTIGTRILGRPAASALTTPEAPQLQALLAVMREEDVNVCAMEVSSHALVKGRVDGVVFDVAVFLNLGRDHLDFHDGMEDYFEAKASLFTAGHARRAVINVDDEHGRRLAGCCEIPVTTFSTAGANADWQAVNLRAHRLGTDLDLLGPDGSENRVSVPLAGVFNASNAIAVIAALASDDRRVEALARGIAACRGVPGRMERIERGQDFTAMIDYAHKPDAVEAVLKALRPVTAGRLIIVLGAGGDRDPGKRAVMGEVASSLADILIVTDDNPRTEDPRAIRAALLAGTPASPATVMEVGGRHEAIIAAVDLAATGDTVLIAGKGHERGQEINTVIHPFDDRHELEAAIDGRTGGTAGGRTGGEHRA